MLCDQGHPVQGHKIVKVNCISFSSFSCSGVFIYHTYFIQPFIHMLIYFNTLKFEVSDHLAPLNNWLLMQSLCENSVF